MNLLPFAHAVAAYAAAAVGRHYEASQHCLDFRLSDYREPKTLRLLAEAYCRAAELGSSPDRSGAPALAQLADEALHEGLRGVETDIRRLAFRSGDVSEAEAEALALSSRAVDGPEARLLESYALAVSASDAADLIAISDDALGGGHGLLALEAAQQASGSWQMTRTGGGSPRSSAGSITGSWRPACRRSWRSSTAITAQR